MAICEISRLSGTATKIKKMISLDIFGNAISHTQIPMIVITTYIMENTMTNKIFFTFEIYNLSLITAYFHLFRKNKEILAKITLLEPRNLSPKRPHSSWIVMTYIIPYTKDSINPYIPAYR
jgi:hypothetical protein